MKFEKQSIPYVFMVKGKQRRDNQSELLQTIESSPRTKQTMDLFGEQMSIKDSHLKQVDYERVVTDLNFATQAAFRRRKPTMPVTVDISQLPYIRCQQQKTHRTLDVYRRCRPKIKEIKPLAKHIRNTNNYMVGKTTTTSPLGSYASPNSQMSLLLNDKQKHIVYSQMYYESPPTPEYMRATFVRPYKPMAPRVSLR